MLQFNWYIITIAKKYKKDGGDKQVMDSKYYYNYQYSIAKAMQEYNLKISSKHFGLIDAHILSLIKSFYDNNQEFHMTNSEIAKIMFVSELTIKRSIDKLCTFGLIAKKALGKRTFDGRSIIYCPNDFIVDSVSNGFKIYKDISDKFNNYNSNTTKDKFSLIDISIIALIASFSDNDQFFYMLNDTMQDILLVSQPVISKSIKLLEKYGVITVQRPTSATRTITINSFH